MDKTRYSSVVYIRPFRGTDSNTDHFLVAVEFTERLSASEEAPQKRENI